MQTLFFFYAYFAHSLMKVVNHIERRITMINVNKETVDTIAGWASLALLCAGSFIAGHTIGKYTSTVDEQAIKAAEGIGYLKCMTEVFEMVKETSAKTN